MSTLGDVVRGAVKIDNFPEGCCFTSFADMIKSLPQWLTVEIPNDITNVVVSITPPTEAQRDSVWFKVGAGGTFVGIYIFATGQWRQIYPHPAQLIRVYGDSRTYATSNPGYRVAEVSDVGGVAATYAWLTSTWHVLGYAGPNSTLPYYDLFDVVFIGF